MRSAPWMEQGALPQGAWPCFCTSAGPIFQCALSGFRKYTGRTEKANWKTSHKWQHLHNCHAWPCLSSPKSMKHLSADIILLASTRAQAKNDKQSWKHKVMCPTLNTHVIVSSGAHGQGGDWSSRWVSQVGKSVVSHLNVLNFRLSTCHSRSLCRQFLCLSYDSLSEGGRRRAQWQNLWHCGFHRWVPFSSYNA